MSILTEMHELLEKASLGPGEKMVFGKVVSVGKGGKKAKPSAKDKYKKKARSKRMRMRKRTDPNKGLIGKGHKKETLRQIDHDVSRGVKKVKGAKESVGDRLADIASRLQDLLT